MLNHEIGGINDVCGGQADKVRDSDTLANFEWADSEPVWQSYPHRKLKSMLKRKYDLLLPQHRKFVQDIDLEHSLIIKWIESWVNQS